MECDDGVDEMSSRVLCWKSNPWLPCKYGYQKEPPFILCILKSKSSKCKESHNVNCSPISGDQPDLMVN